MLKSIILKNFQKHKKLVIKFDPFVTTLSGMTDAGKSTIIRALEWVCLNTPSAGFKRHGSSFVSVELRLSNHVVKRSKGKHNTYKLDGRVYKSFGNAVPDDIQKVLNVEGINFQSQMDPPYWFTESPGQVSKHLNKIVNLEVIDRTLANIGQIVRQCKSAVLVSQSRLAQARAAYKGLQIAKPFAADVARLAKLEEHKDKLKRRNDALESFIAKLKKAKQLTKIRVPDLTKLEELRKKCQRIESRNMGLFSFTHELKEARSLCQKLKRNLKQDQAALKKYVGQKCPTCGRKIQGVSLA